MEQAKAPAAPSAKKYRIRSGAKTIIYPGLAEYTQDALDGPNGAMIAMAMKKTDAKKEAWKGNFEKLIEEVK